ncbi:MAG TPA: hypothetical protein VHK90_00370 [Thermoanaerobaculia bacterium]|nr:hypothetical protein [Thermoanaerobaculia bacterium]
MRRSAGLPLSVGQARLGVRALIALVFLATAAICIGGGWVIASMAAARVVAVVLIVPIGVIGVIAAAFALAPHSRFGVWLDGFVPLLRKPAVAVATAIALWAIAFVVTWRR